LQSANLVINSVTSLYAKTKQNKKVPVELYKLLIIPWHKILAVAYVHSIQIKTLNSQR